MRSKFKSYLIMVVVSLVLVLLDLPAGCVHADEESPYLKAVREFADKVLKYGRDTYGPKHTPLFVDGLNIHTHEPVKWIAPNGDRWILSNLASQQNLFRTLDGLTRITGDPKYKQAAMEAIKYAFDNLRSPNGLFCWGRAIAYDLKGEKTCGTLNHSLKFNYPYYELMWEIDSEATRNLIESFWSNHILDWSNLAMNRIAPSKKHVDKPWQHEYRGGQVFFENEGYAFIDTGSDLFYAAAMLFKQSGDDLPLLWSKRLAHRYVETRDLSVGISGYIYTRHAKVKTSKIFPFDDEFKDKVVLLGTLFPMQPGVGNKDVQQWLQGELMVAPAVIGDVFILPWICQLLIGDTLGEDGKEFVSVHTVWA